jgi:hypothetical protein
MNRKMKISSSKSKQIFLYRPQTSNGMIDFQKTLQVYYKHELKIDKIVINIKSHKIKNE